MDVHHGWFSDNKEWIEYIAAVVVLWLLAMAAATHSGDHVYRRTNVLVGRDDKGKVFPRASHPVVRTHPVTKRKALFVNGHFTTHINELPEEEGSALLQFLCKHSTR